VTSAQQLELARARFASFATAQPERYRALTGSAATEGFFPAWRRPDSAETPAGAEQLANDSR